MDNRALEIGPTQQIKVPGNWRYGEKSSLHWTPVQVDKDSHFLALEGRRGGRSEYFLVPGEKDKEYQTLDERRDYRHSITSAENLVPPDVSIWLKTEYGNIIFETLQNKRLLRVKVCLGSGQYGSWSTPDHNPSGEFTFRKDGNSFGLTTAEIDVNFERSKDILASDFFTTPHIRLGKQVEGFKQSDPDSFPTTGKKFVRESSLPNGVIYTRRYGDESRFRFEWTIEDGQLVVSEADTETGEKRIFSAPLSFPAETLNGILDSRPPYESKGQGALKGLVVPWREIDRTLGVRYLSIPDSEAQVPQMRKRADPNIR